VSVSYVRSRSPFATTSTAPAPASRAGVPDRASGAPDVALIHSVLAPEERLLAVLQGVDAKGSVSWVLTPRRFIALPGTGSTDQVVQVPHASVMCVELRTDPLGTFLKVRAMGRQFAMQTLDAAEGTEFCTLLRDRAGIGSPPPAVRGAYAMSERHAPSVMQARIRQLR
jgi:hypothetical protein